MASDGWHGVERRSESPPSFEAAVWLVGPQGHVMRLAVCESASVCEAAAAYDKVGETLCVDYIECPCKVALRRQGLQPACFPE